MKSNTYKNADTAERLEISYALLKSKYGIGGINGTEKLE